MSLRTDSEAIAHTRAFLESEKKYDADAVLEFAKTQAKESEADIVYIALLKDMGGGVALTEYTNSKMGVRSIVGYIHEMRQDPDGDHYDWDKEGNRTKRD